MPASFIIRLNDIRIWIRLVVSILLSVALIWAGFLAWATYEQKKLAIDQARDFATSLHQMTMAGLTGMMITGTIDQRAVFLDQIKQSNHVESLKVFRAEAVIQQFGPGRQGEVPNDPEEIRVLQTGQPLVALTRRGGEERLRAILPAVALENYLGKNCVYCHTVPPGTVLGAVSMEISLDRANDAVRIFGRDSTLTALLLLVPLGLFIWYFIRRIVTRPLERMTYGLERIAAGDIERAQSLPRTGSDEIGRATKAFNRVMTKAHELIKEQRLSRIVFDNAIEGIMVTDARSRIQMVNRASEETTGYTTEELIGQTPALLRSGKQGENFYQDFWTTLGTKGEWRGEIWNRRKNGTIYPEWLNVSAVRNHRGEVEHYIAIFTDITERKQREEMITFQAFHDALTGLPNRILFRDRLEQTVVQAKRHKTRTPAVMFLDLDRFKQINDTLGHDAGDALLKEVANRLRKCVRESDTVARLGGDEFTVLLPEVSSEEAARAVAEKILDLMRTPVTLAGQEVVVTTSIGVALFPQDGRDPETLLKNADAAMYHVKGSGRAGIRFFTPDLIGTPSRRVEMEERMRGAVARGEMELHYQPLLDLESGRPYAAEALLRWRTGPQELLLPEEFLTVAEESGMIVDIGTWVLETACAQAAAWQRQGLDLVVAVNLAARQLHRMEFVGTVEHALATAGLAPDRLQLEFSETIAVRDADATGRALSAVAHLGVKLVIDDFGVGYSNPTSLKRLAVSALKIDRAFIRDCTNVEEDRAVIAALTAMAHALEIEVIAEGVETAEQLAVLREIGCDQAQGYYFRRPEPAAALTGYLAVRMV